MPDLSSALHLAASELTLAVGALVLIRIAWHIVSPPPPPLGAARILQVIRSCPRLQGTRFEGVQGA